MKLFSTLILSFLFFAFNGIAQTETAKSKNKIPLYAFGIRAHGSLGKQMALLGPELGLNVFVTKKVSLKTNAYVLDDVTEKENMISYLHNLSLLAGIKFYEKKHFFIQVFSGISLGRENYRGNLINEGTQVFIFDIGKRYEETTTDYVGIPVVLSFNRTFKKIFGAELDLFANFHTHTEIGFSVGITLGKNYK